jgi:hypothetical protein
MVVRRILFLLLAVAFAGFVRGQESADADSDEDDHRFRFDPDHLFRRHADQGRSEATLA